MSIVIDTPDAFQPIAPISQAVRCGDWLHVSGLGPLAPGRERRIVGDGVVEQTRATLRNLEAILAAAGGTLDHVVKIGLYLEDLADVPAVNELWRDAFRAPYPARICTGAALQGFRIELDAIAFLGDHGRGA